MARSTRKEPFCWQEKSIRRLLKRVFDATERVKMRELYSTITEIDSDFNGREIKYYTKTIATYSGLSKDWIPFSIKKLELLGIIEIVDDKKSGRFNGKHIVFTPEKTVKIANTSSTVTGRSLNGGSLSGQTCTLEDIKSLLEDITNKKNKEKEKKAEIPKEGIPLEKDLEEMGEENQENIKIKDQNSTCTDQPILPIKNSIQKRDEILKKCLTKFNGKGTEVYKFLTSIDGIKNDDQLERFTNTVFSKFSEESILETFKSLENKFNEGRMPEYNTSFVLDAFSKQKNKSYKQEYKKKKAKIMEPEEVIPILLEQSRIGYEEIIDNELGNYDFTCSCCGETIDIWRTVCPKCDKKIKWNSVDLKTIKKEAIVNIHD